MNYEVLNCLVTGQDKLWVRHVLFHSNNKSTQTQHTHVISSQMERIFSATTRQHYFLSLCLSVSPSPSLYPFLSMLLMFISNSGAPCLLMEPCVGVLGLIKAFITVQTLARGAQELLISP